MSDVPIVHHTVEEAVDAMAMSGVIGPGETLANGWVLIVDVDDTINLFCDRYSKGYQTMGLAQYAQEMIKQAEFYGDLEE